MNTKQAFGLSILSLLFITQLFASASSDNSTSLQRLLRKFDSEVNARFQQSDARLMDKENRTWNLMKFLEGKMTDYYHLDKKIEKAVKLISESYKKAAQKEKCMLQVQHTTLIKESDRITNAHTQDKNKRDELTRVYSSIQEKRAQLADAKLIEKKRFHAWVAFNVDESYRQPMRPSPNDYFKSDLVESKAPENKLNSEYDQDDLLAPYEFEVFALKNEQSSDYAQNELCEYFGPENNIIVDESVVIDKPLKVDDQLIKTHHHQKKSYRQPQTRAQLHAAIHQPDKHGKRIYPGKNTKTSNATQGIR